MTLLIHILTSNQTTLMWFHGLYYNFSSLYWPIFDWPSFSQFLTVWALIRLVWKLLTSGVLPAPQKGEKFISGATGKDIQVSKWLLDLENSRSSWEEGKKGRGEGKKRRDIKTWMAHDDSHVTEHVQSTWDILLQHFIDNLSHFTQMFTHWSYVMERGERMIDCTVKHNFYPRP